MRRTFIRKSEKGQTWIIMAVAITVLIIVLGFAVDSAVLFSNYTKLKRAVDAAAVSAANEYKVKNAKVNVNDPVNIPMLEGYLTAAAKEMLVMHDLDVSKINLHVYICDDPNIQTLALALYDMCPASGQSPRKLVYVQASEEAPTYFLTLIGINSIPITTYSISEAAPIDLVLVFDTSESMGVNSPGYVPDNFDPAACNAANNCQPLKTAKDAATNLVNTLFDGYDQVAIVSFDQVPVLYKNLPGSMADVKTAISNIQLHDDAPALLLNGTWYNNNLLNPSDPEDRDGDGRDTDTPHCNVTPMDINGNYDPNPAHLADPQYWLDQDKDNYLQRLTNPSIPFVPCDRDDRLDAFDWNRDGMEDASDVAASNAWIGLQPHEYCSNYDENGNCIAGYWQTLPMSILSTCTGCGIRLATNQLVLGGRSNSVWVMVLLSDGVANLTDTPTTYPLPNPFGIPTSYPDGYCGGSIDNPLWSDLCLKPTEWPRYCINPTLVPTPPATAVAPGDVCPPGSTPVANVNPVTPPYNPEDYARDMADRAALLHGKIAETLGSDMSIYTIGLGPFAVKGEPLMRYIADIGDDGTRNGVYSGSQGCASYSTDYKECGQYYFTLDPNKLGTIFDSIASRIYTKITY